MAYSEDLRKRTIEYLQKGNSQCEAAKMFGISLSTAKTNPQCEKH